VLKVNTTEITRSANRVLSPQDTLSLSDGTTVFIEMRKRSEAKYGRWHKKMGAFLVDDIYPLTIGGKGHLVGRFRVWITEPTEQEKAKWPW